MIHLFLNINYLIIPEFRIPEFRIGILLFSCLKMKKVALYFISSFDSLIIFFIFNEV